MPWSSLRFAGPPHIPAILFFTYRFGAILLLERVLLGHINQFAKIHRAHKHTQLAAGQSCAQIEIIHPVTERKWPVKTHLKQQQQQKLQRCMGNPVSRTPSSRHHTAATCYRSRIDLHPRSSALSEVEEEEWMRVGSVGSGNNLLPLFLLPPCVLRVETVDRFFSVERFVGKMFRGHFDCGAPSLHARARRPGGKVNFPAPTVSWCREYGIAFIYLPFKHCAVCCCSVAEGSRAVGLLRLTYPTTVKLRIGKCQRA